MRADVPAAPPPTRLGNLGRPLAVPLELSEVVERLAACRMIADAPRREHEWLAAHGDVRRFEKGPLVSRGDPTGDMIIPFIGELAVYLERGSGRRRVFTLRAGEVGGGLPYSRALTSIGDVVIEEPVEALIVCHDHFGEMIRECPVVTETVVHVMVDRARHFVSTDWQDEKMVSLGRLSAGIAHELNNPASAAVRSAKLLDGALAQLEQAWEELSGANLTDAQRRTLAELRQRSLVPATTGVFSVLERSDREDEIASWLESHDATVDSAVSLADSGVTIEILDELAEALPSAAIDAALRWIAAAFTARSVATDVERAATRIYDLVSAMKRFTYMDRATVMEPTDIAQGLTDTVAVLASKAKQKSASVRLDMPNDLPRVPAYAGELNQVWSNLLENALDAVDQGGHVTVGVTCEGVCVIVRFIDSGRGIPPEVRSRMFDPFFTTKPIGQGTGLGLDIAQRIVRAHQGHIEVESEPGRTEFRVTIPRDHAKA